MQKIKIQHILKLNICYTIANGLTYKIQQMWYTIIIIIIKCISCIKNVWFAIRAPHIYKKKKCKTLHPGDLSICIWVVCNADACVAGICFLQALFLVFVLE